MTYARVGLVAVSAMVALNVGAAAAGRAAVSAAGREQQEKALAEPTRRSQRPPARMDPPALPAGAEAIVPLTLTVVTRRQTPDGQVRVSRQTVLRTADRILVATDGTQSEWLFERNPVDTRRVAGYLIDHKAQRILTHQETDLRSGQQLRGWLDVLTLRFDPEALTLLQATADRTTVRGATFVRHVARERTDRGVAEVWWSDRLLFPLRLTVRDGTTRVTSIVESFEEQVAHARLAPPATRFPTYRVLDVADAREHARH